ncbi:hypothetical protein [Salinimicrobium sp. WS361]|jgi:cobalamin synthase|uniref:hypothetical protein n=1 Tax=Salinimicrobium sp. WS361 TaxID=3425123 RepID=UPI003D6F498B
MKTAGLVFIGIIAVAIIILLVAIEIIEFTIGAILVVVAALIFWGVYKWAKSKLDR